MVELVTEVMVLPDGMALDDEDRHHFALAVRWRGPRTDTGRGGYAVVSSSGRHLSRAGKWRYDPEPRLQRHYRWATLEEALDVARAAVNTVTVNGFTWAQWQERLGDLRAH